MDLQRGEAVALAVWNSANRNAWPLTTHSHLDGVLADCALGFLTPATNKDPLLFDYISQLWELQGRANVFVVPSTCKRQRWTLLSSVPLVVGGPRVWQEIGMMGEGTVLKSRVNPILFSVFSTCAEKTDKDTWYKWHSSQKHGLGLPHLPKLPSSIWKMWVKVVSTLRGGLGIKRGGAYKMLYRTLYVLILATLLWGEY